MSAEIPAGAMRFNSDSQKLEYWNGSAWFQVHTKETHQGEPRGFSAGEESPAVSNAIDYWSLTTEGNAVDFANLTSSKGAGGSASGSIRGVYFGGVTSYPGTFTTEIDSFIFSTAGDAVDFGEISTTARRGLLGFGNAVRGGFAGGGSPTWAATSKAIDFISMGSGGNTQDFGDLSENTSIPGGGQIGSPTRALFGPIKSYASGTAGSNTIEYVTIASTGDAIDWGDLDRTSVLDTTMPASNSVRGLFMGGNNNNEVYAATIATLGTAQDFGDLSANRKEGASCASPIRGFVYGYGTINESVSIISGGGATRWGDAVISRNHNLGFSNVHGGL